MRALLVHAVLAGLLMPSLAGAQTLRLTEPEALARLSPDSPRVRAINAGVEIARSDVLAAGRWPNPRVTLNRESVAGITEHLTMVLQPLPITGRRGLETSAASAVLNATSSRTGEELRRARADLRLAFSDLLAAQTRERELRRTGEQLQELAAILGRREAAGDAAGFDRLRAERELLDLETDRIIAGTDRARAQAALANFFATPIDPSTVVAVEVDPPLALPDLPSLDGLVERAESVRGELLALRHEIEAARFSERAAARRLIPEPELLAGTKSSTFEGGDIGSVIMIQALVPLFDRARPERVRARARAIQAEARAEVFRIRLRVEIAALHGAVLDRRKAAGRYRAAAIGSADQVERIAQVSYEAGERGILELLDAYRTSAAARVRQAALDTAARQAEIELEFASGWEIR